MNEGDEVIARHGYEGKIGRITAVRVREDGVKLFSVEFADGTTINLPGTYFKRHKKEEEQVDRKKEEQVDEAVLKPISENIIGRSKRNTTKPARFSFDANQVNATGYRLASSKNPDTQSNSKHGIEIKQGGYEGTKENVINGTLCPLAFLSSSNRNDTTDGGIIRSKVFAKTPSKLKERRTREIRKIVAAEEAKVRERILPNMNDEQRRRLCEAGKKEAEAKETEQNKKEAKKMLRNNKFKIKQIDPAVVSLMKEHCHNAILPLLQSQRPGERRPYISAYTETLTREKAEEMFEINISKFEWQEANMHRLWPGPLRPVERITHSRQRVKTEVILQLLGSLDLQAHAVGAKSHTFANGEETTFDNCSSTVDLNTFARGYSQNADETALNDGLNIPADEFRCKNTSKETSCRCILKIGHKVDGSHTRCRFTPPSNCSLSTIQKIFSAVTGGAIKSLAGLDGEDVIKGERNYRWLLESAGKLCKVLQKCKADTKKLTGLITRSLTFHKTSYKYHLKRVGEHICQCLSCGLGSRKQVNDCAGCKFRDNNNTPHKGPCRDCEETFELLDIMTQYVEEALANPGLSAQDQDEYAEISNELSLRRADIIQWRSHIARKFVEEEYFRKQLQGLQDREAIVVCDWKMKILSMLHRETMNDFFGKRGTSCIGFMTLSHMDPENDEVTSNYHLYFSDDVTQDANQVLAAKACHYNNFITTLFEYVPGSPIKVHFQADGAGCFNSNVAKACIPQWRSWTDGRVVECTYRISVNGGGKSSLDGKFGQLGRLLKIAVNNGHDFDDANSILAAYESTAGIKSTTSVIFNPIRDEMLETSISGLTKYYMISLNDDNSLQCWSHSGFGSGTRVDLGEHHWMTTDGAPPSCPAFTYRMQAETRKSMQQATHSTLSKVSRDQQMQEKNKCARQKRRDDKWMREYEDKVKAGIHCCTVIDKEGNRGRCMRSFLSKHCLAKHLIDGSHKYPSQNATDTAVTIASAPGGLFAAGSKPNRYREFMNPIIREGTGSEDLGEQDDRYGLGHMRKPSRNCNFNWTLSLRVDILGLYLDGETAEGGEKKGKAKFTKEEAYKRLQVMTVGDQGFKKYSSLSRYGQLPSEEKIGYLFSQYGKGKNEVGVAGMQERLREMTAELKGLHCKVSPELETDLLDMFMRIIPSCIEPTMNEPTSDEPTSNTTDPKKSNEDIEDVGVNETLEWLKSMKVGFFAKYNCKSKFGDLPTKQQITSKFEQYKKELETSGHEKLHQKLAEMKSPNLNRPTVTRKGTKQLKETQDDNVLAPEDKITTPSKKRKVKDPAAPKAAKSAYMIFSTENRTVIRMANPDLRGADITALVKKAWAELNDNEMVKWKEKANQDKTRYSIEMETYSKESTDNNKVNDQVD